MKLWLVKRMDQIGYDEYDAKVVSAYTEESARYVASLKTGDEGKSTWTDPDKSMVTEIGLARDPESEHVILESFRAG